MRKRWCADDGLFKKEKACARNERAGRRDSENEVVREGVRS